MEVLLEDGHLGLRRPHPGQTSPSTLLSPATSMGSSLHDDWGTRCCDETRMPADSGWGPSSELMEARRRDGRVTFAMNQSERSPLPLMRLRSEAAKAIECFACTGG